jgi:hypothetical protein
VTRSITIPVCISLRMIKVAKTNTAFLNVYKAGKINSGGRRGLNHATPSRYLSN